MSVASVGDRRGDPDSSVDVGVTRLAAKSEERVKDTFRNVSAALFHAGMAQPVFIPQRF